jgi:hypothetical protein
VPDKAVVRIQLDFFPKASQSLRIEKFSGIDTPKNPYPSKQEGKSKHLQHQKFNSKCIQTKEKGRSKLPVREKQTKYSIARKKGKNRKPYPVSNKPHPKSTQSSPEKPEYSHQTQQG